MKTTFEKIKSFNPCTSGWKTLIGYYRPESLSEEITIEEIIKSNGIKDAVWALRAVDDKDSIVLFCADIAESVLSIYEKRYQKNKAPRECIEAVRLFVKKEITRDQLIEKRNAADAAYAAADAAYAADAADAAAYAAAAYAAAAYAAAAYAAVDAAYAAYTAAYAAYAAYAKWNEITELLKKYCK